MVEQNRKTTKSETTPKIVSKANEKESEKAKMKELTKKKKELEDKLDELKGDTTKGKAVCVFVFLLVLGLSFGFFVGMVKLDVGGVASTLLAPLIGDVPIARSILPTELQKKSKSELAAEQAQAEAESQAAAEAELQDYVDTYSAMLPQDAAKLFESMMPDKEDVVINILAHLTPERRAAILSNMSIPNAADLTEKMQQKVEERTLQ